MATSNDLNISQAGIVVFDGTATFTGVTLIPGSGITITNGNGVSGNPTITSTNPGPDLHVARYIVSAGGAADGANFTTIAAAYAAAVAATGKQTVFVQNGTYTENITLTPGVDITAFGSDFSINGTGNVIISGTLTLTTAGSVTISGIQLQTNSAALLAVTGVSASVVNLNSCFLNITNSTAIIYSSSNASSAINIYNCSGNIGTVGIGIYTNTSGGTLVFSKTSISNSGLSITASTSSGATTQFYFCAFNSAFSTSSSAQMSIFKSVIDLSAINTTVLTTAGTGTTTISHCYFASGTASTLSVGAGTFVNVTLCTINSSNTNAITGLGTATLINMNFTGPSHQANVSTQSGGAVNGLTQGSAPSAGMIGEQIKGTASAISLTSSITKTITSISLTPGIWDLVGQSRCSYSAISATGSYIVSISTTTNVLGSGSADALMDLQNVALQAGSILSSTIAGFRVTINTTTSYFLVCVAVFSAGTANADGRISATRVG